MKNKKFEDFLDEYKKMFYTIGKAIIHSGLCTSEHLCCEASNGLVMIYPTEMTAMDIIRCLDSVDAFAKELLGGLRSACDVCDDCGNCNYRDGDCFKKVRVSPHLLRQAGIPVNAKLCAEVDAEEGKITITASAASNDLSDIPTAVQDILLATDICFDGLEQSLAEGDVIYGTE